MQNQHNDFFTQALNTAKASKESINTPWLNNYRSTQYDLLSKAQFPNKKVEHFKYNRMLGFNQQMVADVQKSESVPNSVLDAHLIAELEPSTDSRFVFIDGQLSKELSSKHSQWVTHFDNAGTNQQEKILKLLGQQDLSYNPFALINGSLSHQGLLIEADTTSTGTIEIIQILTKQAKLSCSAVQLVVDIKDQSELTVITRTLSESDDSNNQHLSTFRLVSNLGKSSIFNHYYLHFDSSENAHFDVLEYNLESKATLNGFYTSTGSQLKKLDIIVNHNDQHTHANLNGIYMAEKSQQVDYHTIINHHVANGTTREVFRGLAYDQSETVFNGRIFIEVDAQKTLAELSNKNLIMSDQALMHTKPELEIYADDVICAHGATVSRTDDESIYYLKARGINEKNAEMILSSAFINELLMELPLPVLADYIRPILFKRFS